jgi:Ala-tRNA(Pro) deacylase
VRAGPAAEETMHCRDRLDTYLRDHDVAYAFQKHDSAFTAQEVAAAEHVPGYMFAKAVMVEADGDLAMAVVPAPSRVDLDKVARALGAREAHLAPENSFGFRFPDCEVGAMPAFGNLYGVPVVVDRELKNNPTIVTQAGSHTETVTVAYADFERLVKPKQADIAL